MAVRTGGPGADVIDARALGEFDESNDYSGLAGDDTLTGGGLKDTLVGGRGSDRLFGDDGSDILLDTNRLGDDLLEGDAGDDTIEARYGADTLSGGAGDDSITFGFGAMLVKGGRSDDLFYSIGDAASVATVLGGSGDDVLFGGASSDVFNGGQGEDLVDYSAATTGLVVNLASGETGGAAAGDRFVLVEDVTGGSGDDVLVGDGAYNVLRAGAGNDTVGGGVGGDFLDGGTGFDILNLSTSGGPVRLNLQTGVLEGEGQGDTIRNFEGAVGSAGLDSLTGDARANRLIGLDGADTLDGGGGSDTLVGGNGDDVYLVRDQSHRIIETADGGADRIEATVSYTLVDDFVETLALIGPDALAGTGNGFANTIIGNEFDNVLDGGGGADTLRGDNGSDTYILDSPLDVIFDGGDDGALDQIFSSTNFNSNDQAPDGLDEFERITLTGDADLQVLVRYFGGQVVGNDGDNFISSQLGGLLTGGAGADTFFIRNNGAAGSDSIADFTIGEDKIQVSGAMFDIAPGELDPDALQIGGTTPETPDVRLIYDPTTGRIYGDNSPSQWFSFVNIGRDQDLTVDDFIVV